MLWDVEKISLAWSGVVKAKRNGGLGEGWEKEEGCGFLWWLGGQSGRGEIRTKTEHDVEENNQRHRHDVDEKSRAPHPERAFGDVASACEHVRQDGERVGDGCEDYEGADEVGEGGFAAELDGAECGTEDC